MSNQAQIGKGIEFKRGSGASPEIFTTVAEVTEIGDFGFEAPLEDATHFQSTFMEWILGMPDGVEFPITVNCNPAAHATQWALLQDSLNRTTRNFRMVFPAALGNIQFNFAGLVRGFKVPATPTGIVRATFTIKISGEITIQDL